MPKRPTRSSRSRRSRHSRSSRRSHASYAPSPGYHHHDDKSYHTHHGYRMTKAERDDLPPSAFALPDDRALPLRSKRPGSERGYIMAATGRLEMMKHLGHLRTGQYAEAKRNILRAARRAGIHSKYEPN